MNNSYIVVGYMPVEGADALSFKFYLRNIAKTLQKDLYFKRVESKNENIKDLTLTVGKALFGTPEFAGLFRMRLLDNGNSKAEKIRVSVDPMRLRLFTEESQRNIISLLEKSLWNMREKKLIDKFMQENVDNASAPARWKTMEEDFDAQPIISEEALKDMRQIAKRYGFDEKDLIANYIECRLNILDYIEVKRLEKKLQSGETYTISAEVVYGDLGLE